MAPREIHSVGGSSIKCLLFELNQSKYQRLVNDCPHCAWGISNVPEQLLEAPLSDSSFDGFELLGKTTSHRSLPALQSPGRVASAQGCPGTTISAGLLGVGGASCNSGARIGLEGRSRTTSKRTGRTTSSGSMLLHGDGNTAPRQRNVMECGTLMPQAAAREQMKLRKRGLMY